jgi:nucleotide-binding universal stress UspA family protein
LIQDFAKIAEMAGVLTESTQSIGSVGRLICETANIWKADLVITGRRGRTTLSELLLGSVSNYILHHAPCSVLIVQPQQLKSEADNLQTPELTHVT